MKKKPTIKRMTTRLDKAVGDYVKARSEYTCDICGIHRDATPLKQLDASHLISRRHLIIRFYECNILSSCRQCHLKYGDGFNSDMMDAVNRVYGDGTTDRLERIARKYNVTKGTYLPLVDFRLQLEAHYKEKLDLINKNIPIPEIMKARWEDYGVQPFNEV